LCPIGERTTEYLTIKRGEVEETLEEGARCASEEARKNMSELMRLMKLV
jgi:hypothetical protein